MYFNTHTHTHTHTHKDEGEENSIQKEPQVPCKGPGGKNRLDVFSKEPGGQCGWRGASGRMYGGGGGDMT